jgi:uncharacterized protein (TIGR00730 family)
MSFERVCLYAGSSLGADSRYREAAEDLVGMLVGRGTGIVYGGGNVGLMGVLADAALELGGEIIGVIPRSLVERELAHERLSELRIVASMHERKATMAELSDAFVALPGGIGTLEEIIEVLTWSQLGFHQKPCALLNVAGYYDELIAFLDRAAEERFLSRDHRSLLVVADHPEALLAGLERVSMPPFRRGAPHHAPPR